jgi:penicillin-binding protein 1A
MLAAIGVPSVPPVRRRRWFRILAGVATVAGLLLLAMLGVAAGLVFSATRGMPSLSQLLAQKPALTTVLYDHNGRVIAHLNAGIDRVDVTGSQIPAAMKQATIAIEDKRFYHHHGIDFYSILRAAYADLRAGKVVQGASTITEQYIKNIYGGDVGGFARKIREAVLAWQLEDRWTKDQILTAYLNTVYYGAGAYGVEAAARTFFHRDVWQLNVSQCALLAALPRDPTGYSPLFDAQKALARRNVVLGLMEQQGYITSRQLASASGAALGVFDHPPATMRGPAAYFVEYVVNELVRRYGTRATFEGGLKVYTSLDSRLQGDAIKALKTTLPQGPSGTLVSIEPGTGYIRAMAASTDWRRLKFGLAWQAHRQLGSAMKPFALLAAVQQGIDPATTFYTSQPLHVFLGQGAVPQFWNVSTFSNTYAGRIDLVQATYQSDNTVFAQLALDIGPQQIVNAARQMGIVSPLRPYPSIVLGTEAVTPLEVADAYATFASEGVRHDPLAIEKIVFPNGTTVTTDPRSTRVVSAGDAYVVDKILEGNTRFGTAAALPSYYSGIAAGKTGTTTNSADAWFCGFNPDLATVVWMGYPQGEIAMPGVQGATYAVPIWGKYYNLVFGSTPIADFPQPGAMPVLMPFTGQHTAASASPSPSPSPSPSASTTPIPQPSTSRPAPSPTHTPVPSPSPTVTPSPSPTVTPAPSPLTTPAPSPTAAATLAATPLPTVAATASPSPVPSATP